LGPQPRGAGAARCCGCPRCGDRRRGGRGSVCFKNGRRVVEAVEAKGARCAASPKGPVPAVAAAAAATAAALSVARVGRGAVERVSQLPLAELLAERGGELPRRPALRLHQRLVRATVQQILYHACTQSTTHTHKKKYTWESDLLG
jgi:hypothetical protein